MTFIPSTGGGTTFPRGLPHQDSIIFYVDASDSSSYTSGTTATDVAGNGTNGTLESTTSVSNGGVLVEANPQARTITGVAAENWQHSFNYTRQKGGETS